MSTDSNMEEITTSTAAALAGLIHSRELSSAEVVQAHLDRIGAVDERLHAFLHVAGRRRWPRPARWTSPSPEAKRPRPRSPGCRSR